MTLHQLNNHMNTVPEALPDSSALKVEGLRPIIRRAGSALPARCGRSMTSICGSSTMRSTASPGSPRLAKAR